MTILPSFWKRCLFGCLLSAAVLVAVYYGSRHYAWPAFKAWRIERMNREARDFLANGDLANALMAARKSLLSSPRDAEAWRIAAKVSAARNKPEAIAYQDGLCRVEPSKENYLELIRLSLRFDVPGYALAALKSAGKEVRDDPEFHRLAAQVYERVGEPLSAKAHLISLTQLLPDDRAAQFDLAKLEIQADPARTDEALRARVLAMADAPGFRVRALSLLLRENVHGKVTVGTAELVRRLREAPELGVPERLLVIEGLFLLDSPEAPPLLARLQADVAGKPSDVTRVLAFLARTGRGGQIKPWFATLPAATRADEDVQMQVADALLALSDPAGLVSFLRDASWPRHEYLRHALLAHAYRDQGRSTEFSEAWKLALIAGGADLDKATALLARVDGWRWVVERHEVVWKIFALVPDNHSAQQILAAWESHQGNTAGLNRLFARIVEVQPGDDARNNLAYTSLLLDVNVTRAGLIAAELASSQPSNPYYETTYAFALYKQGKVAEALARLDAMTVAERADPVRMLFRALCLSAQDDAAGAADLMNDVVLTDMLPEERRLADGVMTQIARIDRAQGNRSRLLSFGKGQQPGTAATGWLALVAPVTRTGASTDMQLADSLYAVPDWAGLRELLRATDWRGDDYLRRALRGYLFIRDGDMLRGHGEWSQALALANQDTVKLKNLCALATQWQWIPERLETLNLIFEQNPTDRRLCEELLAYYREERNTPDLMRVLGLAAGDSPDATDETVAYAYYSLLLDSNVARAQVIARNAFQAAPADISRRMVYVFSLWKQHRAAEAMPLLAEVRADASCGLVPVPLVRATILAQLGDTVAAGDSLARFNAGGALPEENALSRKISAELTAQTATALPSRL